MLTKLDFCFRGRPHSSLELFREWLIVQKHPWVVELAIPSPLQVSY
jgi:hypothetical protein